MFTIDINHNNEYLGVFFIFRKNKNQYEEEIKRYLENNYPPDKLFVISPSILKLKEGDLKISRFGKSLKSINFLELSNQGQIIHSLSKEIFELNILDKIRQQTFLKIFNSNDCILEATNHTFFRLPNDKVSKSFVRVGNSFTNSDQIGTLSFFLTPHLLTQKIDVIYCDTPTIFPLIYASINLASEASDCRISPKIIHFNSHNYNKNEFEFSSKNLFLISTTISGSLPDKLKKDINVNDEILVLYNFKKDFTSTKVICDLSKEESYKERIREYDYDMFCKKFPSSSFEIKLDSDHFLPAPPKISTFTLIKDDAPKWLSDFARKYYRKQELISCYHGVNSKENIRDLYFDIKTVLSDFNGELEFEIKSKMMLINSLPASISGIIYVDELESEYLAKKIEDHYKTKLDFPTINLESLSNFEKRTLDMSEDDRNKTTGTFIVCISCISEGKKSTRASRILRKYPNSYIIYFCGIARCFDKKTFDNLKNNLSLGRFGFGTSRLIVTETIFLPNEDSQTLSWELEKKFIAELTTGQTKINELNKLANDYFSSRLLDLEAGKLIDNVFLNTVENSCLKLNKNYAFFDFYDWNSKDISQAIVYFSILSVLHNYRNEKKIKQSVFERYLIDPENFNRFNDGVIQGALLRASSKLELQYDLDEQHSSKMASIIISTLKNFKSDESASMEFLISICTKRMTLKKSHLKEIVKSGIETKNEIVKSLCSYVELEIILD